MILLLVELTTAIISQLTNSAVFPHISVRIIDSVYLVFVIYDHTHMTSLLRYGLFTLQNEKECLK